MYRSSMPARFARAHAAPAREERGQAMVEFAFVIPILVILVVGVADLGRVFATGLALEAAARNAAEIVANSYLSNPPGPLSNAAPPGTSTYYSPLHLQAARVVCAETKDLPNTTYDSVSGTCPGMPLVLVCVHDSQDPDCAVEPTGATIPPQCQAMVGSLPSPAQDPPPNDGPRWVEIRLCYRFSAILQIPLFSFGDIWLERTRTFVIPCYFVLGEAECGTT
jgi:hypothetical protein